MEAEFWQPSSPNFTVNQGSYSPNIFFSSAHCFGFCCCFWFYQNFLHATWFLSNGYRWKLKGKCPAPLRLPGKPTGMTFRVYSVQCDLQNINLTLKPCLARVPPGWLRTDPYHSVFALRADRWAMCFAHAFAHVTPLLLFANCLPVAGLSGHVCVTGLTHTYVGATIPIFTFPLAVFGAS